MTRLLVPLPTLLSQSLVAMTIGIDNELEQQMPHTTTMGLKRGKIPAGPWLVSWAVWANLLRFVPVEGIMLKDLYSCPGVAEQAIAGKTPGVIRWGYVTVSGGVVRPKQAFRRAAETIFPALPGMVENKWSHHLGVAAVDDLKQVLGEVLGQADIALPRYLPQADNLMWTRWGTSRTRVEPVDELSLVDRLAQVLLLHTLDHEGQAAVPLTMAANLLRVIDPDGTPAKDLVRRSGISKEAMAFLTGWRQVPRLTVEASPKVLALTDEGMAAKTSYEALPARIEQKWARRFGKAVMTRLRSALETVVVDTTLARSPLAELTKAPEGCWRSWIKPPQTLPHFPMILHRGGYPDGA